MKTDTWPNLLRQFIVAASLLTRLPLPRLSASAFSDSARAVWAFPLAGALVGLCGALAGLVTLSAGLPAALAAGVVLGTLIMVTGAMHEDGLADVADGFWGGHSVTRRLEIMKDSQIGSFGTLALILVSMGRWGAYAELVTDQLPAIIAVAAMSRAFIPAVMHALPHARADGLSHSVGRPDLPRVIATAGLGLALAILLTGPVALALLLVTGSATLAVALLARPKLGGQTGDVLGASQQISEIACLFALIILAN